MLKEEIRSIALKKRMAINTIDVQLRSFKLVSKILSLNIINNAKTIGIYMPIKNEVDTTGLVNILKNKTFAVPVVEGKDIFFAKLNKNSEMIESTLGIKIPKDTESILPDVCIVPMVAFDADMNRVGYGMGYYDRFFAKHDVCKIGVAFKEQEVEKIPTDEHDIKMDFVISI